MKSSMGVLKKAIENYLKERSKSQLIPNYCLTISLSREGMGISKQGTSIEEAGLELEVPSRFSLSHDFLYG